MRPALVSARTPAPSPGVAPPRSDPDRPRPPAVPGERARTVLGGLVLAGMVAVAGLWLAGGGAVPRPGLGPALTSLGRLTGLLASYLLLVQVLAMARLPVAERAFGQDGLIRLHRALGTGSVTLLAGHVVLTVLGYADGSVSRVWDSALEIVLELPAMLLATAGAAALLLVAVSSHRRIRARMRYESWHLLHLYAYLGCLLALPHQLWTGTDFLAQPAAAVFWWGLWAAAVLAVLVFRLVGPLVRSLRHRLVVQSVRPAGAGVTTVVVSGRRLDRIGARAGQFCTWRFLDGPGWTRANPYSLAAAPRPDQLQLAIAAVGDSSRRASLLRPGTRVLMEGPYGRLHGGVRTRSQVTLLAAGIGVAPMVALLQEWAEHPQITVTVIFRVHDRQTAPLLDELDRLAAGSGVRVVLLAGTRLTARRSWLPQGWQEVSDDAALLQLVPDLPQHDVFVCGSPQWVQAVEDALRSAGVPAAQIHAERFAY